MLNPNALTPTVLLAGSCAVWTAAPPQPACDTAALDRTLDAAEAAPDAMPVLLDGIARACPGGDLYHLTEAPPELRPLSLARYIEAHRDEWDAACPGGLTTFRDLMRGPRDQRVNLLRTRCETDRLGWTAQDLVALDSDLLPALLLAGRLHTDAPRRQRALEALVRRP